MADVDAALRADLYIGSKAEGDLQPLTAKSELLHTLLENEQMRLLVWLYPLDHGARRVLPSRHSGRTPQEVNSADSTSPLQCTKQSLQVPSHLIKTAWLEHPSVAIQLPARFPSPQLSRDLRALLLEFPEAAISEPDALETLLGSSLPSTVGQQLKVLTWLSAIVLTLMLEVPPLLGSSEPYHSSDLLPACLP